MPKKKSHMPTDMIDLLDISYIQARIEDKRKYVTGHVQSIMAEAYERDFPKYVTAKLIKIKTEKGIKTPDYISEDKKLLFEITTINIPFVSDNHISSNLIDKPKRITTSIEHAEEKDISHIQKKYSLSEEYNLFAVAYVSYFVYWSQGFFETLHEDIHSLDWENPSISGILFIPEPASNLGEGKDLNYGPIGYFTSLISDEEINAIFTGIKIKRIN